MPGRLRTVGSENDVHARPLVTIAIPTYNRPALLKRAVECVAAQSYDSIELIVGDNGTPGDAVERVVDEARAKIRNLTLIKHREDIGAYANFFRLLDVARGQYFMWLADDDEIYRALSLSIRKPTCP